MEVASLAFHQAARRALADAELQRALARLRQNFQSRRAQAVAALPEFEALRRAGEAIRDHVLQHLDHYLERFVERAQAAGAKVHIAATAGEARRLVLELLQAHGVRRVTKSKSMVAEEVALAEALEAAGIRRVETDLGEYIIQLANEPPSHLIGPAVHMTEERIARLFAAAHGEPEEHDPKRLVAQARRVLRQAYLEAEAGITGANFLVAETGSVITVTNEGNAELTQGLPPLHIVVTSIEKLVPTMEHAFTLLRLLARSATGQEFATYTTVLTGPRRADDRDGPEAMHIVLVDNGRSAMLGSRLQPMLRCIRCSACMNHCPVYLAVGGHAYGWTYVGPMGAVLTPALAGIDRTYPLPEASTFCGRCADVCPVRIPLPDLMRVWREEAFRRRLAPLHQRAGLRLWAWLARHPRLYRRLFGLGVRLLAALGGRRRRLRRLPLAGGWTRARDLPAPEGPTFLASLERRR